MKFVCTFVQFKVKLAIYQVTTCQLFRQLNCCSCCLWCEGIGKGFAFWIDDFCLQGISVTSNLNSHLFFRSIVSNSGIIPFDFFHSVSVFTFFCVRNRIKGYFARFVGDSLKFVSTFVQFKAKLTVYQVTTCQLFRQFNICSRRFWCEGIGKGFAFWIDNFCLQGTSNTSNFNSHLFFGSIVSNCSIVPFHFLHSVSVFTFFCVRNRIKGYFARFVGNSLKLVCTFVQFKAKLIIYQVTTCKNFIQLDSSLSFGWLLFLVYNRFANRFSWCRKFTSFNNCIFC